MSILLKPLVYICIIILALLFKKFKIFKKEDSSTLSKIILNFTLPAAIIVSFADSEKDSSLLLLVIIGFFAAIIPLILAFIFTKKKNKEDRILYMISLGGLNIGIFALPVLSSFFGSYAAILCGMFDMGNAILMTGGAYALTVTLLKLSQEEEAPSLLGNLKIIAKNLLSSPPVIIYFIVFILILFNISIPSLVGELFSPIAAANPFVSMFMIGLMFQFSLDKSFIKDIFFLVILRLFFSLCVALFVYFVTPFPLVTRQILTVIAFSPIGSLSAVFVERAGGDSAKASCATTFTIITSFIIMTTLSLMFLSV